MLMISEFQILVNYDEGYEQMLARGAYDQNGMGLLPDTISSGKSGEEKVAVALVHFGVEMWSADVEQELDRLGLRPATVEELLTFGATFPEVQLGGPIAALGAVFFVSSSRHPRVVGLGGSGIRRLVGSQFRDNHWDSNYRFLAVRK